VIYSESLAIVIAPLAVLVVVGAVSLVVVCLSYKSGSRNGGNSQ
jgi:hypothetical protein